MSHYNRIRLRTAFPFFPKSQQRNPEPKGMLMLVQKNDHLETMMMMLLSVGVKVQLKWDDIQIRIDKIYIFNFDEISH